MQVDVKGGSIALVNCYLRRSHKFSFIVLISEGSGLDRSSARVSKNKGESPTYIPRIFLSIWTKRFYLCSLMGLYIHMYTSQRFSHDRMGKRQNCT